MSAEEGEEERRHSVLLLLDYLEAVWNRFMLLEDQGLFNVNLFFLNVSTLHLLTPLLFPCSAGSLIILNSVEHFTSRELKKKTAAISEGINKMLSKWWFGAPVREIIVPPTVLPLH